MTVRENKRYLFTFQSTHQAMTAQKRMKKEKPFSLLVPTPTEIYAECGFSLELEIQESELNVLIKNRIFGFAECYLITSYESENPVYEKIHTGQS